MCDETNSGFMSTSKSSILKWIEKRFQWVKKHQAAIIAIATIIIAISTYYTYQATDQIAEITQQEYEYHPPKVTVTYGQVIGLYILRNESFGTYISLVGLTHVYNSGTADDVAVIPQKGYGLGDGIAIKMKNESEDVIHTSVENVYFEGSPYQIPIIPGASPTEVPILITTNTDETIDLNYTIELILKKEFAHLEVINPATEEFICNITSLEPINITYKMGENTADAKTANGEALIIDVGYTDESDTYWKWRKKFMEDHGIAAPVFLIHAEQNTG